MLQTRDAVREWFGNGVRDWGPGNGGLPDGTIRYVHPAEAFFYDFKVVAGGTLIARFPYDVRRMCTGLFMMMENNYGGGPSTVGVIDIQDPTGGRIALLEAGDICKIYLVRADIARGRWDVEQRKVTERAGKVLG